MLIVWGSFKIVKKKNLLFFGKFDKKRVKIVVIEVSNIHNRMFIKISNIVTFFGIHYFNKSRFKLICFE